VLSFSGPFSERRTLIYWKLCICHVIFVTLFARLHVLHWLVVLPGHPISEVLPLQFIVCVIFDVPGTSGLLGRFIFLLHAY
jgi:hypothetical protein